MLNDRELVIVLLILISIYKLNKRIQHENAQEYDPKLTYKMIEDMMKYVSISLVSYALLDFGQSFYDQDNILASRSGRIITVITIILFYYQMILPPYRQYTQKPTKSTQEEIVLTADDEAILKELIERE